jgi:trimeric autotransporter adhesin
MKRYTRIAFNVLTTAALGATLLGAPAVQAAEVKTTVSSTTSASGDLVLTFPDVKADHWARSHIAKLAASKIVKGYDDGSFAPKKEVTQQEAVVMAIRMMGLEEEALAESRDVVLGFDVDAFFRPYVVKALEMRILNLAGETEAAASGNSSLGWGKRPASREWVAKLVVKAIGKDAEAKSAGAPSFADASKISSDAAGYVQVAVDMGIVTGFKEDNTFRPNGAVTRAEIATFLSRSDKYLSDASGRSVTGYITNIGGAAVSVRNAAGQTQTFNLHANTAVFQASGGAAALSALANNQQIKLVQQNNTAYYIEILNSAVQFEKFEGTVDEINLADMTISLIDAAGAKQVYTLASNVAAVDKDGIGISIADITKMSTVVLERLPGTTEIATLKVTALAFNKTGEGTVEAIDAANRKITLKPIGGGAAETYPIAGDATLQLSGQAITELSTLQAGDTVAYEVVDSKAVSINITKQRYVIEKGEMFNVADDTITVLEGDGELKAYFLASAVAVKIEGLNNATLKDLQKKDTIQLTINGNTKRVEKITVLDREISDLTQSTIINYDAENQFITVRNDKNLPQLYNITDRTEILLDGVEMPKSLYSAQLVANRKVNLLVTDNQLIRLNIVTKVEGTISAVNLVSRTITLDTVNGKMTFPFSIYTTTVDIPKRTGESINEIGIGMRVRLNMDANLASIQQIQVRQSFVYTLTSVELSTRKLVVQDAANTILNVQLHANAPILNANGQTVTMTALKAGEPISVDYYGEMLDSVTIPNAVRGRITTLDTVSGKLAVTDNNNNISEFSISGGVNVKLNDKVVTSLAGVRLNDRVQVVVDGSGIPYVTVAAPINRTFSSYNAQRNEITFKKLTINDTAVFGIHSSASFRTAAGLPLDPAQLKDNDKVTIYIIDGKIVELVK